MFIVISFTHAVVVETKDVKIRRKTENAKINGKVFLKHLHIPYAEPPVGKGRFEIPFPKTSCDGEESKISHSPVYLSYSQWTVLLFLSKFLYSFSFCFALFAFSWFSDITLFMFLLPRLSSILILTWLDLVLSADLCRGEISICFYQPIFFRGDFYGLRGVHNLTKYN